mmetsp:Transcript_70732/g.82398  ORF Transcript_70732/g.82398 Transcript_70732/m.82398 type:complete len:231 (-) Transcript_70732:45-737(-)
MLRMDYFLDFAAEDLETLDHRRTYYRCQFLNHIALDFCSDIDLADMVVYYHDKAAVGFADSMEHQVDCLAVFGQLLLTHCKVHYDNYHLCVDRHICGHLFDSLSADNLNTVQFCEFRDNQVFDYPIDSHLFYYPIDIRLSSLNDNLLFSLNDIRPFDYQICNHLSSLNDNRLFDYLIDSRLFYHLHHNDDCHNEAVRFYNFGLGLDNSADSSYRPAVVVVAAVVFDLCLD